MVTAMTTLERRGDGSESGDEFRDVEPLALKSALSKKCALCLQLSTGASCKPCFGSTSLLASTAYNSSPSIGAIYAAVHASRLVCRLHRRKDWRVLVTGHSLGAGVAVLLSMHLRTYYPGGACAAAWVAYTCSLARCLWCGQLMLC